MKQIKKVTRQQLQLRLNKLQQDGKLLIARMDNTLHQTSKVKQDLGLQGDRMEKWEDGFRNALSAAAYSMFCALPKNTSILPSIQTPQFCVNRLLSYKQIAILTGAGVSKLSGIPTFRGENGLYQNKFEYKCHKYEPSDFINYNFFRKNPEAIWEWVNGLHQLIVSKNSSINHIMINKMCNLLSKIGKKINLITTNIDGYHLNFPDRKYQVSQIHGNLKYVICENCQLKQEKLQKLRCKQCGSDKIRPNIMFFDQKYEGRFGGDVYDDRFDFVIVIGSSLETGLSYKIASNAQQAIQINPKCVLKQGKVYQFHQNCQKVLGDLIKEIERNC